MWKSESRVRNKAVGVNFIDVYFRTGVYKVPSLPYTPGPYSLAYFIDYDLTDIGEPRGYMVSFGQSSGTPDSVPLSSLATKSLFTLKHYNVTRDELLEAA
ncbi:hypothetical protein JHK82_034854 [Glycine max]|uniref:Uncharacterized protein n=1 Tax=Glycine soja TaxID=3848 RepID=A0A445HV05_GLYSO|nr:hypothetical protein JHK85_035559 [Glycine max]KAG4987225.1 hypothetical protein JHK86_034916 [Glycine max]KAG5120434.1 hypothetical protein JHK82_034854 [Glycine max]KAG5141410.1 hypothetical protein JHK84_035178 [Glycine max]RZB77429.1 hypothetical protein D0Y65_035358 [Glycine soja]